MVIGHEKGADTEGRIKHNFGMARPEGYRKAVRLMELADRFGLPVITLVDTAGAYPGIDAEERGQAEAIARSTECCLGLGVPIVVGDHRRGRLGRRGRHRHGQPHLDARARDLFGGLAGRRRLDPVARSARAIDAATNMKITAQDLLRLGVIDGIIPEPVGGAHRDGVEVVKAAGDTIAEALGRLRRTSRRRDSQGAAREIPGDGPRQFNRPVLPEKAPIFSSN